MNNQLKEVWETPKLETLEVPRTLSSGESGLEDFVRGFQEEDPPVS